MQVVIQGPRRQCAQRGTLHLRRRQRPRSASGRRTGGGEAETKRWTVYNGANRDGRRWRRDLTPEPYGQAMDQIFAPQVSDSGDTARGGGGGGGYTMTDSLG